MLCPLFILGQVALFLPWEWSVEFSDQFITILGRIILRLFGATERANKKEHKDKPHAPYYIAAPTA